MSWFDAAEHKPLDRNFGPALRGNLGLVLHVQDGNGELHGWFNQASTQASAHFWVSKTGRIVQYVDSTMRAWAQKAGNGTYCSVETEGRPNEPLTAAQIGSLARIYAEGARVHGWPFRLAEHAGDRGFGFHSMDPSFGHPFCPGEIREGQRQAVLDAAQGAHQEDDLTPDQDKRLTTLEQKVNDLWTAFVGDAGSPQGQRVHGGLAGFIHDTVVAAVRDAQK
jgi:hypothetical protein